MELLCTDMMANLKEKICTNTNKQKTKQINKTAITYKIYNSIDAVSQQWNMVNEQQPVFLQTPYLSAIEKVNKHLHDFRYVAFFVAEKIVAVAYFQLIELKENIGIEPNDSWSKKKLKQVVNQLKFNLLICGNAYITGDFGFHYNPQIIDVQEAFSMLQNAINDIKTTEKALNVVLIKDFAGQKAIDAQQLLNYAYNEVHFQPNMQIFIRDNWQTIDDYKADIVSKYKKRHRSVIKKASDIEAVILTPALIKQNQDKIIAYYKEIIDRSEFNLGAVDPSYFYECVCRMPQNFIVKGYFHNNHLAGFISYIFNNGQMESHFIGYDSNYNKSHRIYNYILYDLLETAIDNQQKVLTYGRTAMEIKSTIGAIGTQMNAYLWVKSPIIRPFLKSILAGLRTEEWQARNPFKNSEKS